MKRAALLEERERESGHCDAQAYRIASLLIMTHLTLHGYRFVLLQNLPPKKSSPCMF
jgi:hypothetical protein